MKQRIVYLIVIISAAVAMASSLTACSVGDTNYAPVTDISSFEKVPKQGIYRVQPGETLYSIAWRYGMDYRYLARRNGIAPPYHIVPSQIIYLRGKASAVKTYPAPQMVSNSKASMSVEREPTARVSYWIWPTRGDVIGRYSASNKGINIGGRLGQPIHAAAAGKVVYSGNGLRGYGNLIIIKHNSVYLTAYAYNDSVLVKEGDWVTASQVIAGMGAAGSGRVMLHFEIRVSGKPVDPLRYLDLSSRRPATA